jgi:hypothetical protein
VRLSLRERRFSAAPKQPERQAGLRKDWAAQDVPKMAARHAERLQPAGQTPARPAPQALLRAK